MNPDAASSPPAPISASVSTSRRTLSLLALAVAGFGIGASEFTAMGLLPQFSQDLLPTLYALSPELADSQTSALISAYAIGVVIGAPTIGVMVGRFPRKSVAVWLIGGLLVGAILSAIAPTFETVFIARVLAGLPHGAFFGIAGLIAADLLGPGNKGKGMAIVLSGLTVANMVGVPLMTWIGQIAGWRWAYALVAIVFAISFLAVVATVPHIAGDPTSSIRSELRAFRLPQVWFTILIGAVGFSALFSVYSYVSPMITEVAGAPEAMVPIVLVIFGAGMVLGNLIGGWLADKGTTRALFIGFASMAIVLVFLGATIQWLPLAMVGFFLFGAAESVAIPVIQTRLVEIAHEAQTVAAATNHSALNIGNALGAALGGVVVGLGFGYRAPIWVALVMVGLGALVLWISLLVARRFGHETPTSRLQALGHR